MRFPILTDEEGSPSVPWDILDEEWAFRIHMQTLMGLAERGGLDYREIVGNIDRLSYDEICALDRSEARARVEALR